MKIHEINLIHDVFYSIIQFTLIDARYVIGKFLCNYLAKLHCEDRGMLNAKALNQLRRKSVLWPKVFHFYMVEAFLKVRYYYV